MPDRIVFHPNPTQKRFIESRAEADLFAARMGEGKSKALVWSCFYHTIHNTGANWAIIRDTWENLRRTTLRTFMTDFGQFGEWRAGDKRFIWRAERAGLLGAVDFLGLDEEGDASKLQSLEIGGFGMDEPAPAADSGGISELIFTTAMSRLRQPGMKWYAAKLAENAPDETHWTYKHFVDPGTPPSGAPLAEGQAGGFKLFQSAVPENEHNLPPGYYARLSQSYKHRPDLIRRFVDGGFGFQQIGKQVTPEWSDDLHLARNLEPVPGVPLQIGWDGGLNPTCIITQVTPLGHWLILESYVGDGIGMAELIEDVVKPRLTGRYRAWFRESRFSNAPGWRHIGDPALNNREQSSSANSAARVIRRELGGPFLPGPKETEARLLPLRAVMRKLVSRRALMLVDREHAREVWYALRGGWHRNVSASGVVGDIAKDMHSHPGDAMGYLAATLFPLGRLKERKPGGKIQSATYFGGGRKGGLGFERPGLKLPSRTLGVNP
jgi:hypothetical protein